MLKPLCVLLPVFISFQSIAKNSQYEGFSYPNKAKNAISISFDDARHSQVDTGLALLDKYQVKATFYVSLLMSKNALKNGKWQ